MPDMRPARKSDIFNFLAENKEVLLSLGVRRIGLFGSFVRNSQKPDSDIDVLVEFESGCLNYDNFINLAFFLEDNLQTRVDLVTLDGLSPHLGPHILKEVEYASL